MKRLLRLALSIPLALLLYILLAALGVASLVWNLIAMLLHPMLPADTGRTLGRAVIAHAYRIFWGAASLCGMMRIDSSCLDALLLVARLPRSACIMKADLMRNVFLGAGARLARYIRNDSARTMVRLAVDDLKNGGQLVIFPEGTRTVKPPLNAFRPGVTLIAKLAQAPIQTVFIDTDSPYLAKGWPLWRVPPLPIVFRLRLGQRFAPSQDSDLLLKQIEQYFRHSMEQRAPDAQPACQTSRAPTLS